MKTIAVFVLAVVVSLGVGACARHEGGAPPDGGSEVAHPAPPGTPLERVRVGMGQREVQDLLGQPTDQKHYVTGKAFIPYYFGPDSSRVAYYYKGMGRVLFSGGNAFGEVGSVLRVEYDPSETGYAR